MEETKDPLSQNEANVLTIKMEFIEWQEDGTHMQYLIQVSVTHRDSQREAKLKI